MNGDALVGYDLFTNICIVVAFLLAVGQIFKDILFDSKQTLKNQSLLGAFFGVLGTVLMLFTIETKGSMIVDLRNISIICAGIMGGPLAAAFTAAIIALFRIILFGINTVSITAFINVLTVGAGIAYISSKKLSRLNKFIWMFLYTMLITNVSLFYLIRDKAKLLGIMAYYWPVNLSGAAIAYFTCEYIASASSNFKTMSYYRVTADNLLDMISTHKPGGMIKFVSPSIFQIFGYTPEEFVETSIYEYIHSEDIDVIKKVYSNFIEKEANPTYTFRMRHKNGKFIWVETSMRVIKNDDSSIKEMVCVTRDISMRKEIEQELRMSSARFKAIFDNAGTGIVLRDTKGGLIDANPAFLDMVGYSMEEVSELSKIVHPDDYENIHELLNNLAAGKCSSDTSEIRYLNKNQQIMYAEVTSTLIPGTEHTPTSIIRIVNDITERKIIEEELRKAKLDADKLAATDFLTGVLNRRAFSKRLEEEFQRAVREKSRISLILADIDYFKEINDIHGHQVGDHVLQKFTRCLTNVCRPYDFIGRQGGEEFIICLPNTGYKQGKKIAERIRRAVEELSVNLLYLKEPIKVTASFGLASSIPNENESTDTLIMQADDAMYKAKEAGRNKVCTAFDDNNKIQ